MDGIGHPQCFLGFLGCVCSSLHVSSLSHNKKLKRCYIMVPRFSLVWLYFSPVFVHFWWVVLKKKHCHMSSTMVNCCSVMCLYFSSQMPCYTFGRSNHFYVRKWLAYAGILCLKASLIISGKPGAFLPYHPYLSLAKTVHSKFALLHSYGVVCVLKISQNHQP